MRGALARQRRPTPSAGGGGPKARAIPLVKQRKRKAETGSLPPSRAESTSSLGEKEDGAVSDQPSAKEGARPEEASTSHAAAIKEPAKPPILPLPSQAVQSPAITGISAALPKSADHDFSLGETAASTGEFGASTAGRSLNAEEAASSNSNGRKGEKQATPAGGQAPVSKPKPSSLPSGRGGGRVGASSRLPPSRRPPQTKEISRPVGVPAGASAAPMAIAVPNTSRLAQPSTAGRVGGERERNSRNGEGGGEGEEEEIDPNTMTLQQIIMAKKMGKPLSEDSTIVAAVRRHKKRKQEKEAAESAAAAANKEREAMEAAASSEVAAAPQLKIGADGSLQIDENTLSANVTSNTHDLSSYTRVNDDYRIINCKTYSKQAYARPWTQEETDLFYEAISCIGTDFTLIAKLFPARTRRQVKAKFVKEDKVNAAQVDRALKGGFTSPSPIGRERIFAVVSGTAPPPQLGAE